MKLTCTIRIKYSVRKNTEKLSKLMRDEILPGKDVAAYWIEYVIRHGGTKHLQLASKNMPFYQRHLLDVALFLEMVAIFVLLLSYYTLRFLVRKCLKRKPASPAVKPKLH